MRGIRFANFKYHVLMHLIVFIWGFTGILGKLIHLDFYRLVFFRMIIAGLSLFIYLLFTGKKFRIINKRSLLKVLGVGVVVVLHWLTFFMAIQVSSVSLVVLCMSTTALHVSWLEPLVMKRKFSKIEFILGMLVIIGVVFISKNLDSDQVTGMIWGLFSALLSASFAVFNAYLNKKEKISSAALTVHEMLFGAGILFVFLITQGRVDATFFVMNWSDFAWLLFLGIICTSLAFMLMIDVINRIGAYSATLSINLEPVYSILMAILILQEDEFLGVQFYLGTLFILLIVFSNPVLQKLKIKREKRMKMRRT